MKKIRKNYSLEFKIGVVSLSEQRDNVSSVAHGTRDHAKNSMFEYIETFYNTHRRYSAALGNLTIKEYQNLMSNQSKNVA